MPQWNGARPLIIVSACMTRTGVPTFRLNEVEVTQEQAANGIQYYLAEAQLLEEGYEDPFVHFGQDEAPSFLIPAVRKYLGLSPTGTHQPIALTVSEDR